MSRESTHPNEAAFPKGLSGPALRALHRANIKSMIQLSKWKESDLAELHGMGPKGIRMLKQGLVRQGRHLREE